jgi:hypothetical protein
MVASPAISLSAALATHIPYSHECASRHIMARARIAFALLAMHTPASGLAGIDWIVSNGKIRTGA